MPRHRGRKAWDPTRTWPKRFDRLEELASSMIGDGKIPDLFFVTVEGDVVVIAQDFAVAYRAWKGYSQPPERETALENRTYGVIASVEPEDDDSPVLVVRDDSSGFRE